ncbi:hypothetical protein ACU8OR_30030 (plasmid) [Rhizobium leguminosarum]
MLVQNLASAFPPVLSPLELRLPEGSFTDWPSRSGVRSLSPDELATLRRRVVLTDGGVYDNHGLEPVVKRFSKQLLNWGYAICDRSVRTHHRRADPLANVQPGLLTLGCEHNSEILIDCPAPCNSCLLSDPIKRAWLGGNMAGKTEADYEKDRVRQSERTIDNLKRLYAVLFSLSFAIVAQGAATKITAATSAGDFSLQTLLLNAEMTASFLR